MDPTGKKRSLGRLHREHCNREVSKSMWYVHYKEYFDSTSGKWKRESSSPPVWCPDFNFAQESSDEAEDDELSSQEMDTGKNRVCALRLSLYCIVGTR